MCIVFDCEELPGLRARDRLAAGALRRNLKLTCHWYTERDVCEAYPALEEVRCAIPPWCIQNRQWGFHNDHARSLAWGFHCECVGHWFMGLPQAEREAIRYVWILEDDVGVCGSLQELIEALLRWIVMGGLSYTSCQ